MPMYSLLPAPVVVYGQYNSQRDKQNSILPDANDLQGVFYIVQFRYRLRLEKGYLVEVEYGCEHLTLCHLR